MEKIMDISEVFAQYDKELLEKSQKQIEEQKIDPEYQEMVRLRSERLVAELENTPDPEDEEDNLDEEDEEDEEIE